VVFGLKIGDPDFQGIYIHPVIIGNQNKEMNGIGLKAYSLEAGSGKAVESVTISSPFEFRWFFR